MPAIQPSTLSYTANSSVTRNERPRPQRKIVHLSSQAPSFLSIPGLNSFSLADREVQNRITQRAGTLVRYTVCPSICLLSSCGPTYLRCANLPMCEDGSSRLDRNYISRCEGKYHTSRLEDSFPDEVISLRHLCLTKSLSKRSSLPRPS